MSPQRRIIGHKKRAGSTEEIPDHIRSLIVRLMVGPPLGMMEMDLVHAYQHSLNKDTP